MLEQSPQSALLLRNRFAAWVGMLVFIAACTFMFSSSQAGNMHPRQGRSYEIGNEVQLMLISPNKGRFDLGEMIELQLKEEFLSQKSNLQDQKGPFRLMEE